MLDARFVPRPLLIVFILLCALVLAAPLVGARGNSAGAQACQKGGWESLATSQQPTIPFTNQDACVSYAAQGGRVVAVSPAPVAHMEFIEVDPVGHEAHCSLRGWLVGETGGISSVLMEVWFHGVSDDGTLVPIALPITLSAPSFDSTTDESYPYFISVPDRITAEATYSDGSVRPLPTSFAPVGCAGYVP